MKCSSPSMHITHLIKFLDQRKLVCSSYINFKCFQMGHFLTFIENNYAIHLIRGTNVHFYVRLSLRLMWIQPCWTSVYINQNLELLLYISFIQALKLYYYYCHNNNSNKKASAVASQPAASRSLSFIITIVIMTLGWGQCVGLAIKFGSWL